MIRALLSPRCWDPVIPGYRLKNTGWTTAVSQYDKPSVIMRAFMRESAQRSPCTGYIRHADNSTPLKRFSRRFFSNIVVVAVVVVVVVVVRFLLVDFFSFEAIAAAVNVQITARRSLDTPYPVSSGLSWLRMCLYLQNCNLMREFD